MTPRSVLPSLPSAGILFFSLVLFSNQLNPFMLSLGVTPLMAAVLVGAAQNVFSKGSKYSLFDPCKEMAYIPLDQETKTKGKAAIDVICNPLGKSGGALIQQAMILGFGSLAASTPYLAVILFVIVGMWISAANSLNKEFTEAEMEMLRNKMDKEGDNLKVKSTVDKEGFVEGEFVQDKPSTGGQSA